MQDVKLPRKSDARVRVIAASYRTLTSPASARRRGEGQPVLVACSGGADSAALVIALIAAGASVTVGHVVHDLRRSEESLKDRDSVEQLAVAVGARFIERSIRTKSHVGNVENTARRLRYLALIEMADEAGVRFVATGHHAMDQAESVLMALSRGAGPDGLSGIAARRVLRASPRVWLIRPMLDTLPQVARDICRDAGWSWAEDATNADASGARVRSAIRHRVLPELLAIMPAALTGIARSARLQGQVGEALRSAARGVPSDCDSDLDADSQSPLSGGKLCGEAAWRRTTLRQLPTAVLGELLRQSARTRNAGGKRDRLSSSVIAAAVKLIRSDDTDPHVLNWPGVRLRIDSKRVSLVSAGKPPASE